MDAKDRFLTLLDGCTEPEAKRKIIGTTFIHVFQVLAVYSTQRCVVSADVEWMHHLCMFVKGRSFGGGLLLLRASKSS